jgi:hypothetical protein
MHETNNIKFPTINLNIFNTVISGTLITFYWNIKMAELDFF